MLDKFDTGTFKYFDLAQKQGKDKEWFIKNEQLYIDHVKTPMLNFINTLWSAVDDKLPGIEISHKKILRPVRPSHKIIPGENAVKNHINVNFSEKENSRFEWNPGIYLQLSSDKTENYVAIGLSMISSRQMKCLRDGLTGEYDQIHSILGNKKLKTRWGGIHGERYTRFPRQFLETQIGAEYLWCKEFYLFQQFSRKDVTDPGFPKKLVEDITLAVPFLQWVRETVGTFKGVNSNTPSVGCLRNWT